MVRITYMQKGKCRLCLHNKDLCKKSHIIPKFLYKLLTGGNNKIVCIDSERSYFKYNSEYEGNILCEDCDSRIIGKLDDYGAKFFYDKFPNDVLPCFKIIDGEECVVRENDPFYDYKKMKLFLLSILWRSSISTRPLFQKVKLRREVEESLRLMIINGKPDEPDEYVCFIRLPPLTTMPNGKRGFNTFDMPTMAPCPLTTKEMEICQFVIQGTHYYFILSRPVNMKVVPGVDKHRLVLGINSREQQARLHSEIIELMKNHSKYKNG